MSKRDKKFIFHITLIALISFACSFGAKNNLANSSNDEVNDE